MHPLPVPQPTASSAPATCAARPVGDTPWPADLLEAFCLRMAGQGMCVSRVLMQHDRRYGLEQLAHAHNMADDTLRAMAVELFRQFEQQRSGISPVH